MPEADVRLAEDGDVRLPSDGRGRGDVSLPSDGRGRGDVHLADNGRGRRFLSGGADGFVRSWCVHGGGGGGGGVTIERTGEHRLHDTWIHAIALDPHDRAVLYTASEDGTVRKWRDFRLLSEAKLGAPVYAVAPLADGGVAVGDDAGRVSVLGAQLELLATSRAHERAVRAVVPVRLGMIATASDDGSIALMGTAADGPRAASLYSFHRNFVRSLCLLPNGRLASGSYDGRIKVWDFEPEAERGA
eukprot:423017-Prymnesium_polylepis.1